MLIVLTTMPNFGEADRLARLLVDEKFAACVQILPQMTSIYSWEGAIQTEPEHLLLIKTVEEKFEELSDFIRANHSYDVPEIVAIEADKVSDGYLRWVKECIDG